MALGSEACAFGLHFAPARDKSSLAATITSKLRASGMSMRLRYTLTKMVTAVDTMIESDICTTTCLQ